MWVGIPHWLPVAIQEPPVFPVSCPRDKAPAIDWERWGRGWPAACHAAAVPGRLRVAVDGCVCSPPPSRALCSGKGKAHGGAWVIYGNGEDGKQEHKHMARIGNGA